MRTFVVVISIFVLAVANVEAVKTGTPNVFPLIDFTEAYNRHEEMQEFSHMSSQDDSRNWATSDRTIPGSHSDNQQKPGHQNGPSAPNGSSTPGTPGHPPLGNPNTPVEPTIPTFPSPSYPTTGIPNYPQFPDYPYLPGAYPNYPQTINPWYPSPPVYPNYSPPGYPFNPPYQGYPSPCYYKPKIQ